MAIGYVPDIRDENFVCQKPCGHRDCAANRAEWEDPTCHQCGRALKPGDAFQYRQGRHVCLDCIYPG